MVLVVSDGDGPARSGARRGPDAPSSSIRRRSPSAGAWGGFSTTRASPRQALEHLRRALAMNPTSEENHRLLGLAYLQLGQYDDAAAALREAIAVSGSSALATAGLGAVAAARGRAAEARAVIGELTEEATRRYVSPVAFAIVHAALGENDAAFAVARSGLRGAARLALLSQGRAAARRPARRPALSPPARANASRLALPAGLFLQQPNDGSLFSTQSRVPVRPLPFRDSFRCRFSCDPPDTPRIPSGARSTSGTRRGCC